MFFFKGLAKCHHKAQQMAHHLWPALQKSKLNKSMKIKRAWCCLGWKQTPKKFQEGLSIFIFIFKNGLLYISSISNSMLAFFSLNCCWAGPSAGGPPPIRSCSSFTLLKEKFSCLYLVCAGQALVFLPPTENIKLHMYMKEIFVH